MDDNNNNGNYYNQGTDPTVMLDDPMRMDNNYDPNMNMNMNPNMNMSMNPQQQSFYGYGGMQPQPPMPPNQGSKNNSLKLVLLTVIAVLLVVGIVIGALLLIQKKKENNPNESQNSATDSAYSDSQDDNDSESAPDEVYVPATAANEQYNDTTRQNSYPSPVASWAQTIYGTVLPSSNMNSARSFGADQAIDGYANTCWCVNTSSSAGAGGSFTVHLKEYSKVSGISIINGNTYMPSEELYKLNGQVRNFKLTFSDGTTLRYTADYNYASSEYETFRFTTPIITDKITFTVESGYTGSQFTTNVCLGELKVF